MSRENIVLGADASSFLPYLGMISGLLGGAKPAGGAAPSSEMAQLMQMQMKQQEAARIQSEKNMRMVLYGALGLGALGLVYLLAKK